MEDNDIIAKLELTKDELKALVILTEFVGGSPTESLRGKIDDIRQSIFEAFEDDDGTETFKALGIVPNQNGGLSHYIHDQYNAIYFKDRVL